MTHVHLYNLCILQIYEKTHTTSYHVHTQWTCTAFFLSSWPPCCALTSNYRLESVAKSTLKDNLFLHMKGQAFIHIHHTFADYPAFLSPIQTSENLYLDMVLIFNPQSIKTRNTSDFSFPSLEAFKYISIHWELDFLTISQEKVKDHLRYISQMYFLFEI